MTCGLRWLGVLLLLSWVGGIMASSITHLPSAAERAALPADGGEHFNRLIHSTSPYLLQHAENPVDWYEWGEAAFEKARAEDKPVLLSVGYSTCHWCHVMARESFESQAIADVMNQSFVCVKVDREERPDVDQVYMNFVQATTGRGGWPMTVFITPDTKPFYGGTYFRPEDFQRLLGGVATAWADRREDLVKSADRLTSELQKMSSGDSVTAGDIGNAPVDAVIATFAQQYDAKEAGFGEAPKFPRPVTVDALLAASVSGGADAANARSMALETLRAMARGGMYDHIGGGFHRYSVDRYWHVPHFEKMLYDQGQLVVSYVAAWQITADDFFADVARETCRYVLRDLRHPDGGLYSAEDADSILPDDPHEHGEGAFYVWRAEELKELLGKDYSLFAQRYGVADGGNIRPESDPLNELTGMNTLYAASSLAALATTSGRDQAEIAERLAALDQQVFAHRAQRPRPHLDDKIIAAWNGLMISGLARAGLALDEPEFVAAAVSAAQFVQRALWDADAQRLYRTWRGGQRGTILGFADDYSFVIAGVLDLFTATQDPRWLTWAQQLQAVMDEQFTDPDGGWFDTPQTGEQLLVRTKETYDGAEPAATSMAIMNGLRLAVLTGEEPYQLRAEVALQNMAETLRRAPHMAPLAVQGWLRLAHGKQTVMIAGELDHQQTQVLRDVVESGYLPFAETMVLTEGTRAALAAGRSWLEAMGPINGLPTAYACEGQTCQQPTSDPTELHQVLQLNAR